MGLLQWLKNLFNEPKNTISKTKQTHHYNWDQLDPVDAYEWRDQNENKKRLK